MNTHPTPAKTASDPTAMHASAAVCPPDLRQIRQTLPCLLLIVLTAWPWAQAGAQDVSLRPSQDAPAPGDAATTDSGVPIETARMAGPPGHRAVRDVQLLHGDAGRMQFSRQGDRLAFDKPSEDGRYDVYVQRSNGAGERCLTCDIYDLKRTNVLDPVWHPSGDYIVVQVQSSPRRLKLDPQRLATPLRGVHSELWVVLTRGRQAWRITRASEQGGALIGAAFSYEGDRLLWNERLSNVDKPWGHWGAKVADFKIRRGLPKLGKINTYDGGWKPGFTIAHGFTPDDRGLLVAASPDPSQPTSGRDVMRLDLATGEVDRMLSSPDQWDDLPTAAPRGEALVWVSDRGLERSRRLPYRGDLWLMVPSQKRYERLTYFNDPESTYYLGDALIDDVAWHPKANEILVHVVWAIAGAASDFDKDVARVEQAIYRVTLEDSFPD